MAITNLQVVTGYYDSLGTPSIESAVTAQLAAGWIPQGSPVLTDVYGQVAQSMVKSTNLSTTAYTIATGATPMAPDATWDTLGNPTWIESGRYLQAYTKGDQVSAKVDLANQVDGVLPITNGGTGVSLQTQLWNVVRPSGATPLAANPVVDMDAATKGYVDSSSLNITDALALTTGASTIGTSDGNTVQQELDFLSYANGVRLSEYLSTSDPLNNALTFARSKKLPLIIDTDLNFTNPIVMYTTDRIYCFGGFVLTKVGNGLPSPSIPSATAPARNGRQTNFNVDAAIIVVHPENNFALRNEISGLRINTNSRCDYAVFAPFWAHHMFSNCMFYGFRQGIRSYDAYAHVWTKIYSNYWYSSGGVNEYSDRPAYQLEDPEAFTSGTSGTISNVTSIFYTNPWRVVNREYTTFTCCGGEGVDTTSSSVIPYVFDLLNCNDLVINTPYSENLYGGFFKIRNDNAATAVNRGGSIIINGPQLTSGIRGTRTDLGAKLFDVDGLATVSVNGGYMVTAATGYYLDFIKVAGDAFVKFSGTDMRYLYANIKNRTSVQNGLVSMDVAFPPDVIRQGVNTSDAYQGVVPFNTVATSDDRYGQAADISYTRTAVPGVYDIEATVSFYPVAAWVTLSIKSAATPTDTGSTLAVSYHNSVTSGRSSATIKWRGRLTSNRYIYVSVTGGDARMTTPVDTIFRMKLL